MPTSISSLDELEPKNTRTRREEQHDCLEL